MAEAGAPAPPAALLDVPEGPEQLGVHTLQTFGGRKSTPLSDFKLDKHRSGTPYKLEDDRWDPDHRVIGGVLGKHGLDTAEAEFARRARLNESDYGELGSHASGGTAGSPGGAGSPPRRVSTPAHHPPRPPHEGDSDEAASELMLTTFPLDLQTSLESSTASAKPAAGLDVTGRGCFKPTAPKIVSKRKSKAVVLREGDASDAAARAGQESEIPNFKGSSLGRFPLVSADFWTSDHLSGRPRSMGAFSGTRARGTLMLKRG